MVESVEKLTNGDLADLVEVAGIQDHTKVACKEAAKRLRDEKDCKRCCIAISEATFRRERELFERQCSEKYVKQGEVLAETARQNVRKTKIAEIMRKAIETIRDMYTITDEENDYKMFRIAVEALDCVREAEKDEDKQEK